MTNKKKAAENENVSNVSENISYQNIEKPKRKKEIYTGDFFVAKLLIKINSSVVKEKKFINPSFLFNKMAYNSIIEFINDDYIVVENPEASPFIKAKIELLFYKNNYAINNDSSSNYLEYKFNYKEFIKDVYKETNFAALVGDVNTSSFNRRDKI